MTQTQKTKKAELSTEVSEEHQPAKVPEDLAKDLDEIIADIDEVLEENAEEFVSLYIQQGGE